MMHKYTQLYMSDEISRAGVYIYPIYLPKTAGYDIIEEIIYA